MTKLELKHLACYLPYGLKINTKENEMYLIDFANKKVESKFRGHLINIYEWDEIKPILRPLSDLDSYPNYLYLTTDFESCHLVSSGDIAFINTSDNIYLTDILTVTEFMLENHFDVFGLIPAGLAISYKEAGL